MLVNERILVGQWIKHRCDYNIRICVAVVLQLQVYFHGLPQQLAIVIHILIISLVAIGILAVDFDIFATCGIKAHIIETKIIHIQCAKRVPLAVAHKRDFYVAAIFHYAARHDEEQLVGSVACHSCLNLQ